MTVWDEATWVEDWGHTGAGFVWHDPPVGDQEPCECGNRVTGVIPVKGGPDVRCCPACAPFNTDGERMVARARWRMAAGIPHNPTYTYQS